VNFEIKYAESGFGSALADEAHFEKFETVYKSRPAGEFDESFCCPARFLEHYQIARNVWHHGATKQRGSKMWQISPSSSEFPSRSSAIGGAMKLSTSDAVSFGDAAGHRKLTKDGNDTNSAVPIGILPLNCFHNVSRVRKHAAQHGQGCERDLPFRKSRFFRFGLVNSRIAAATLLLILVLPRLMTSVLD